MRRIAVALVVLVAVWGLPHRSPAQTSPRGLPECTVAQLQGGTCVPARVGNSARIKDGQNNSDCTVGTGTTILVCEWDGVGWVASGTALTGDITTAGTITAAQFDSVCSGTADCYVEFPTTTEPAAPGTANNVRLYTKNDGFVYKRDSADAGGGIKLAETTGATTPDNCAKFDASGALVDAGVACGAASTLRWNESAFVTDAGDYDTSFDGGVAWKFNGATATLQEVICSTISGSAVIDIERRTEAAPNATDASPAVDDCTCDATPVICGLVGGAESTLASGETYNLVIVSEAAGVGLRVHLSATY